MYTYILLLHSKLIDREQTEELSEKVWYSRFELSTFLNNQYCIQEPRLLTPLEFTAALNDTDDDLKPLDLDNHWTTVVTITNL